MHRQNRQLCQKDSSAPDNHRVFPQYILWGMPEAWAEPIFSKLKTKRKTSIILWQIEENPCQGWQRRWAEYSYQAMGKRRTEDFIRPQQVRRPLMFLFNTWAPPQLFGIIRGSGFLFVFLFNIFLQSRPFKNYFKKNIFWGNLIFFFLLYSALLHLRSLRFHCANGWWDRTQDSCNWCIGSILILLAIGRKWHAWKLKILWGLRVL